MTIATLLADARKKSGMTLNELSAKSGVHRSAVYAIETGGRNGGFSRVVRLLVALKVPMKKAVEVALAEPLDAA